MSQHDTGIECPVCKKANIMAEVGTLATESEANIPVGPASSNYYYTAVTSFHCSQCQVLFHHPPGKPNMAKEILDKIHKERKEEEARKDREEMDRYHKSRE